MLEALREKLRCRELWVVGANKYRNPDDDLPQDFDIRREEYYRDLGQPLDSEEFVHTLQQQMMAALDAFDQTLPRNPKVRLLEKKGGWIALSPLEPQEEPTETEAILRRFTRTGLQHPTYRAFAELGKAIKTIFLCRYLQSEALRREIHEGLNTIESWNAVNHFIFFGHEGEFATNNVEMQEIAALSLHLLQISLVFMNTLLIQHVLSDPQQMQRLKQEDLRALTPLIYSHVNPYGMFRLNMSERMHIEDETVPA